MTYAHLADLIVAVHLAFAAFIVVGLVFILIGRALRWEAVRNFWFRSLHLLAIGIVACEALGGVACPLTVWEHDLRERAGQKVDRGATFIGEWARGLLFYQPEDPSVIEKLHVAFGALVLTTFVLVPPRWPRGRAPNSAVAGGGDPAPQSPTSQ